MQKGISGWANGGIGPDKAAQLAEIFWDAQASSLHPAGKTALSLDGALQPNCTPLEDPVLQREEGQPPLTPTGKDPCFRIFPGDDFIRILPIFFETPIEFVQLLLSDGDFVGIGG
jgi:hypothetical protein